MKKLWADFKAFIKRGNVVDLAVGVVIGAAFNKIVNSIVNDIIMPFINWLLRDVDVLGMKYILRAAEYDEAGIVTVSEIAITYGNLINAFINFIIIAITLFIIVKVATSGRNNAAKFNAKMQKMRDKAERLSPKKRAQLEAMEKAEAEKAAAEAAEAARKAAEEAAKPTELSILAEIRDMLKEQNAKKDE